MDVVLALDVGATKVAAGLVDARGEVLARRQVAVRHDLDADGVFGQVADLVGELQRLAAVEGHHVLGCGVGCAGPITPGLATVSPVNLAAWREFPLRDRLAEVTGVRVAGDLDTKALALGEGWKGAAVGERDYLAMVVSTGVGGGVVLDGRLLEGESGNAGHIGHVVVVPDGHPCGCGAHGCLEAEISGRAIEAITGRPPAEAHAGLVEHAGRLLGRAVASVANLLDLDLAVVGGSVALGFGVPFFAAAQAELDANCRIGGAPRARIVPAGLGDAAPLVGAAAVGWRGLGR